MTEIYPVWFPAHHVAFWEINRNYAKLGTCIKETELHFSGGLGELGFGDAKGISNSWELNISE